MKKRNRCSHFVNFFYYSFVVSPICCMDLLLTLDCIIFFVWLFLNLETSCLLSILKIKIIKWFLCFTYCFIIGNYFVLRIFIIHVFFILSVNHRSESSKIVKQLLDLLQSPFVNINQDRELLAESANCKHIVPWIPIAIGNNILKLALEFSCVEWIFQRCIPNIRISWFWATNQILAICRKSASYHLVTALRPKKSFFDSGSFWVSIINQPDAVVSWLNIQLILNFWVYNDGIYLVSLHFWMIDQMMVSHNHLVALNWDSLQVYLALAMHLNIN